ncbi:hypothetical protein [Deinococcus sp.]|uniref:hypothetical protein n=1 Tax=Deinococcus sp. TaxID=47478 RepID=UPI003CC69EE1
MSRASRTERVRALWEVSGVLPSAAGRRAASQGVTARLAVHGVTREDVLPITLRTLDAGPAS